MFSIKAGYEMAGNFQDDEREQAMCTLFNLYKDAAEGRSGTDAFLNLRSQTIPFELKTTSKGSVTTVRDFGPAHIEKWKSKHWLIGFFLDENVYYKYGSPSMMAPWIEEKRKYIMPDFVLAKRTPLNLSYEDLYAILGNKVVYTYQDAKTIQKRQYNKSKYLQLQDLDTGYSPKRMLEIVRDRAKYLMERGSTLNNPHIPFSYFNGWQKIRRNHAQTLRQLVEEYYNSI